MSQGVEGVEKVKLTTPSWPFGHDTPPWKGGESEDNQCINILLLLKEEYPDVSSGGGGCLFQQPPWKLKCLSFWAKRNDGKNLILIWDIIRSVMILKKKDIWVMSFFDLPKPDRMICRTAIVEKLKLSLCWACRSNSFIFFSIYRRL